MSKAPSAGGLAAAAFIGLLAGLSLPALAQVHKCAQADGSVSFQSAPCAASDAAPPQRVTAAQLNASRRAQEQARTRVEADPYADSPSSRPRAPGKQKPSVASPLPENARIVTDEDRKRACTIALNNQAVLSQPGKAYSFDRTGNRKDVAEPDRDGLLAIAKRNEAKYCK
jgi:hypothetical protein